MVKELETKFRYDPTAAADEAALLAAKTRFEANIDSGINYSQVFEDMSLFDRMERSTKPAVLQNFRHWAKDSVLVSALDQEIFQADLADDNEKVMRLVRIAYLMGRTEDPLLIKFAKVLEPKLTYHPLVRLAFELTQNAVKTAAQGLGQTDSGTQEETRLKALFERNKQDLEAKKQAQARAQAQAQAGPQPSGAPPKTAWTPETPQQRASKPAEWLANQAGIETKWQQRVASGLPTGTTRTDAWRRFESAMALLHEEILAGANFEKLMAEFDYLLPKVWHRPDIIERFFQDPVKNRIPSGDPKPRNIDDLPEIAKVLFIPANLSGLTTTPDLAQAREIRKNQRNLWTAVHGDRVRNSVETTQDLKDLSHILAKAISSNWKLVNPLLK